MQFPIKKFARFLKKKNKNTLIVKVREYVVLPYSERVFTCWLSEDTNGKCQTGTLIYTTHPDKSEGYIY